MKKVLKKIGSILIDVLIVIVFIISTIVVIASITANRTGGQPSVFGYVFSSVQTDSMQGTIDKGDFVVGKFIDDSTEIKVGDIVSFEDFYEGKKITITHRVVEVRTESDPPTYITQGDNEKYADDILRHHDSIHSVYKFRIPFLGSFIDFLKTPFGFVICLVLPLLTFIGFQAYKLITLYLRAKKLELVEEAAAAAGDTNNSKAEISEEEKNAIIAEYLARQAQEKQAAEVKSADDEKNDTSQADAEEEEASVEEESSEIEDSEPEEQTDAEVESESDEKIEADEDGDKN